MKEATEWEGLWKNSLPAQPVAFEAGLGPLAEALRSAQKAADVWVVREWQQIAQIATISLRERKPRILGGRKWRVEYHPATRVIGS
jgi:hypothetical protein